MNQDFKTMSIEEIKAHFDVGEDIPLDIIKLLGQMNISALPKNFDGLSPSTICAFATNKGGRSAIFYDEYLMDNEFSEFPILVQALAHYMLTGENNFRITPRTQFSEKERNLVFELLMPENQVEEILDKLILPTTHSLSKIFRVPQEFVRKRLVAMKTTKNIAGYNY